MTSPRALISKKSDEEEHGERDGTWPVLTEEELHQYNQNKTLGAQALLPILKQNIQLKI